MNKCLLLVVTWWLSTALLAQNREYPGALMIAGGGTENYDDWSDTPYGWVVSQAENGRIAVITYDESPSSWMPSYFESLGAVAANTFSVASHEEADSESLYEDLITYDGVFFKGGDQAKYYEYYKDTRLQQAVAEIYERGGVLSGTSAGLAILSGVIFSAENGTVYSHEALGDPDNQYMVLRDDFLQVFPGFIFDSHVAERARFGRLLGFLGHWKLNHNEAITGIGVDDKTAFCIGKDGVGRVYGTGAVRLYRAGSNNNFRLNNGYLLADNVKAIQLLHNDAIHLPDYTPAGLSDDITPEVNHESYTGTLLAASRQGADNSTLLLNTLLAEGQPDDSVLVVSTDPDAAEKYMAKFANLGFEKTGYLEVNSTNGEALSWQQKAARCNKFLYAGNQGTTLTDFMKNMPVGEVLFQQMQQGVAAFAGSDASLIGRAYCTNYQQIYASYDGELLFDEGLGLLATSVVMPETFSSSDYWENTMTAVPYMMNLYNLRYGIWLAEGNIMKYYPDQEQSYLTAKGSFPVILMINDGTTGGLSTESAVSSGKPRQVAGFSDMTIKLLDETSPQLIGSLNSATALSAKEGFRVWPNPAREYLHINGGPEDAVIFLTDMQGAVIKQVPAEKRTVFLAGIAAGMYYLTIKGENLQSTQKVIIK